MANDRFLVRDMDKPKRRPFQVTQAFLDQQKDNTRFQVVGEAVPIQAAPGKKKAAVVVNRVLPKEQVNIDLSNSAKTVISFVRANNSPQSLELLRSKEQAGKDRKSVVSAITARLTNIAT